MQASYGVALPARKLGKESGVRGSSPDIENFPAQQILVRRNRTAIRIRWKQDRPFRSDYVLNQRQNSIEGKFEVELIDGAVDVDGVAGGQLELIP